MAKLNSWKIINHKNKLELKKIKPYLTLFLNIEIIL
jgi:hypothetical protein